MLIHKRSMGVLDLYWTGRYKTGPDGVTEPVMGEYTLEGAELDPAEWWETPRGGALGRKVRRMYPCCTAVTGADGSLVDVDVVSPEETEPKPPPKPAGERKRRQRRRRAGLLEQFWKE